MNDYVDDVERILEEADGLPDGITKVNLIEQAINLADSHQDLQLGYEARKKILPACLDAGQPDRMLVAYTWCLAQCDAHPEEFEIDGILWEYRWVISEMPTFPSVTRRQIEEALADITRRYEIAGSTMRAVHLLKVNVHISLKDKAGATAALEGWKTAKRDWLSDDAETERAFQADYEFFLENYAAGIKLCDSVLKGKVKTEHFFGSDSADLLYPLWITGQHEVAESVHKKGYRYVAWNPRYVDCCGDHVEFLALTKNWARATRLVEKHMPTALAVVKPTDRMAFLRAVYVYAKGMLQAGKTTTPANLPTELDQLRVDGQVDLQALADWCHADCKELSQQYDARNGNDWFTRRLARCDKDVAKSADL